MTICEYFFNKYIEYKKIPENRKPFLIHEDDKFSYIMLVFEQEIGCDWEQNMIKTGITKSQLDRAVSNGFIKLREYSNFRARELKQTRLYVLTKKGIKAMFKAFKERW